MKRLLFLLILAASLAYTLPTLAQEAAAPATPPNATAPDNKPAEEERQPTSQAELDKSLARNRELEIDLKTLEAKLDTATRAYDFNQNNISTWLIVLAFVATAVFGILGAVGYIARKRWIQVNIIAEQTEEKAQRIEQTAVKIEGMHKNVEGEAENAIKKIKESVDTAQTAIKASLEEAKAKIAQTGEATTASATTAIVTEKGKAEKIIGRWGQAISTHEEGRYEEAVRLWQKILGTRLKNPRRPRCGRRWARYEERRRWRINGEIRRPG